jgi:hypothetical protein
MAHFRIELKCESPAAAHRAFRAIADTGVASSGPTTTRWPGEEPTTDSNAIALLEADDQEAVEAKVTSLVGDGPEIVAVNDIRELVPPSD